MTLYILLFQHQKRILITNIVIIISSILLIVNVSLLQAKSTTNNVDDIITLMHSIKLFPLVIKH